MPGKGPATMTKTQTAPVAHDLDTIIEAAESKLNRLLSEQQDHAEKLRAAIDGDDSAAVIALHRRHAELPVFIAAARVDFLKAVKARYEAKADVATAEYKRLEAPMLEAQAKVDAAKQAHQLASGQFHHALETARDHRQNAGSMGRELDNVRAELRRLSGAVVR